MTVLRSNLNERSSVIRVDAALESPTYPAFYTIDSETVKVLSGADTREWKAERGVAESIAASHPADVALVAVDAPFGAGGLPTGWTQDASDPATVDTNGGGLTASGGIDTASSGITTNGGAIDTVGGAITTSGGAIDTAGGAIVMASGNLEQAQGGDSTNLEAGTLDLEGTTSWAILNGSTGQFYVKPVASGVALRVSATNVPESVINPAGVPLITAASRPEVPANPSPQDNTDALVTLGLITQSETGGELNISGISADGQPGAVLSLLADADATHAGSVNLDAGDGGADAWGGSVGLHAGDGDAGASSGASIELGGGGSDGLYDGEMLLQTGGSTGASGEALVSSNGSTVWGGLIVAEGVPSGAPVGKLPIAYDSTAVSGGTYIWNGAAWVKIATIL